MVQSSAKKKPSAIQKRAKKTKIAERRNSGKTQVRLAKPKQAPKSDAGRVKEKPVGHAPHSARITAPKGPVLPLSSRTSFVGTNSEDRKWLVVDAAGQTVGRIASEIASLLRGKHKPTFTPNNDAVAALLATPWTPAEKDVLLRLSP